MYGYLVLPFGLACTPSVFTKLLKVPLYFIHADGHIVFMYIDDAFLQGDTPESCTAAISAFLNTMVPLGFLPYPVKSQLFPSQTVEVLGFVLNSVNMTITVSQSKADHIYQAITKVLDADTISIRELAQVTGKVLACCPAAPLGMLNYRSLERQKLKELRDNQGNYNAPITLNFSSRKNLKWWQCIIHNTSAPI